MTTKTFCDRCGAEFVPSPSKWLIRTLERFSLGVWVNQDSDDEKQGPPDLCDPCKINIVANGSTK